MTGVQILVEWLATFIEVVFYFLIVHVLAPEQFKRKKQIMMFLVITSIITTGVILLNFIDTSSSLTTIVYSVLAMSFGACVLFQGSFHRFLFVSVIYMTGLNFVESLLFNLLENIAVQGFTERLQSGFSVMHIYVAVFFKIVDSLVILIVCFVLKRELRLGKMRIALVCAILGFISIIYLLSIVNVETNLKVDIIITDLELDMIQTIVSVILIFFACSVYFYYQMRNIRREQENTAMQNKLLAKNYQMAKESYESNARLYHDMGNHFSIIQGYLADGKVGQAQAYLDRLGKDRTAYSVERFTGIEAVDYILSQKAELARQQNIETSIHAEYPKDCNIDPIDLCTILTNLLDNGIEACGKLSQVSTKRLSVTIRRINQFIILRISNSCMEEPTIIKGSFATSKTDKQHHGWGMKNIKSAVEKYYGIMEYEYSENVFTVSIMLFYQ